MTTELIAIRRPTKAQRFGLVLFLAAFSLLALCYLYQAILLPICLSLLFCYLVLPLVDKADASYRLSRSVVAAIILTVILGVLGLLAALIIPSLYQETVAIVSLVPRAFEFVMQEWVPVARQAAAKFGVMSPDRFDLLVQEYNPANQVGQTAGRTITFLVNATPSFLFAFVSMALLPVISFFLLRDMHKFMTALRGLVPADLRPIAHDFRVKLDQTMRSLIKGNLIVAAVDGTLYIIGLSILGVEYSLAIGAVAGICRLVPYLDVIVGLALSGIVLISHFQGWYQVAGVLLVFGLVQFLDGMAITPRVIGDRVGLHPVLVIISVIAFGDQFGFYGVLLAVPILAIAKVILQMSLDGFRRSTWYTG